ncbi:MAG: phosphoenolpyruvate--protein phosphotransferase, partial [Planctomycetota bacterium]
LLSEIGRIIGEARSHQEVLVRVVRLIASRLRADVCAIYLLDGARTTLTMAATEGLSADAVGKARLAKGEGLTWQVLEKMAPVVVEDAPSDPHYKYLAVTHEEPFHSYLGMPLQVRGLPIGAIFIQTRERRRFTEDEVRALSAIASQVAPVVDNARLLSLVAGEQPAMAQPPRDTGPRRYYGTPCSTGIVSGHVLRLVDRVPLEPPPAKDVREELARLENAFARAREELLTMQQWLRDRNAEEAALVFSVQLMMLEDPTFEGRMRAAVESGVSAHAAVLRVSDDVVARFANLRDLFFRERSDDVRDLTARLLRNAKPAGERKTVTLKGKVAVLPLLAPSRMVSLCAEGVSAVLAGGGGATSHAALLARSLDLPLVVGLGDFIHEAQDGDTVLVDAASGEIVLRPPESLVAESTRVAAAGIEALRTKFADPGQGKGRIRFEANVSLWGDAVRARAEDADGIGLYRTEFGFLMRPDLPSEDEQYVLYRRVVEEVAPLPVTFRLLDAGGDKLVPALGQAPEPNPFLGYRSLRLLLDHPEILGAQTRAILHAIEGSAARVLVPMVGSVEEFRAAREMLGKEGMALPPVGAMIELPSALMQLDEIARAADYLCVGTNDLTQHMLGVDRTNARVTRYFDLCHPSMVRALHAIAEAAKRNKRPLAICGEAASNPLYLPLWLGLGVTRLSVHTSRLRVLRALEARLDDGKCREVAQELLAMDSARKIRTRLEEMAEPEVRELVRARLRN